MKIKALKNVTFIYYEDVHKLLIKDNVNVSAIYVPAGNIKSLVRFILSQVLVINGKTKKKKNEFGDSR